MLYSEIIKERAAKPAASKSDKNKIMYKGNFIRPSILRDDSLNWSIGVMKLSNSGMMIVNIIYSFMLINTPIVKK
jgi:hypothetical protein